MLVCKSLLFVFFSLSIMDILFLEEVSIVFYLKKLEDIRFVFFEVLVLISIMWIGLLMDNMVLVLVILFVLFIERSIN